MEDAACKYQQRFRRVALLFFLSRLTAETSPLPCRSLLSKKSELWPLSLGNELPIWLAHLTGGSLRVVFVRVVHEDY